MGPAKKTKNFKYVSTQENPNEPESFDRYNRGDDHSVAEGVTTHGPMSVDAEVQTVLTASDIQSMEDRTAKLANRTQLKRDIFIEDVCKNDRSVRFWRLWRLCTWPSQCSLKPSRDLKAFKLS